jgi:hypothetical protein
MKETMAKTKTDSYGSGMSDSNWSGDGVSCHDGSWVQANLVGVLVGSSQGSVSHSYRSSYNSTMA